MTRRGPGPALRDFLANEAAGGIVLIAAAALAMLAANLPATAHAYFEFLHIVTGPDLGHGPMDVHLWINDALMALFFLLVGLEIKREFIGGELASWEQRRLPVIAAAAGMLAPAAIYLAVTAGHPDLRPGWAIPSATDIAFAVGLLALLGRHAPAPLRLFLTTVAIVDDLGSVAIIALAYTAHIDTLMLGGAALVLVLMHILGKSRVRRLWPYLLLGLVLWLLIFRSGVHATIAGVATAMMIPVGDDTDSPLRRLEHALHPWVAFAIVPLFAFANAGVSFAGMSPAILLAPLPAGVAAGLFFGKQLGIFGGVWLAEKLHIARRPEGATWLQLYGVALLAGIGFTMSLFIGGLAFPRDAGLVDQVRLGVLGGSLAAALAGFAVLRFAPAPRGTSDQA